jgi:ATP-binding cassette subfamily B protein
MKARDLPVRDHSAITQLRALYGMMSPKRRRHLLLMLAVMLVVAVAELVTIGSAVPFLSVVLAPGRAGAAAGGFLEGGSSLVAAALLFAGAGVVAALARLLLAAVSQSFAFRLGHELGTAIFSRMLRQPYGHYVARNTSELLVGMEKVQAVVYGVLLPAIQGVSAVVLSVCITVLLFLIHPHAAALGAVMMTAVYFTISLATRSRLRSNSAVLSQNATARMKLVREGLGGIRDILLDQSQEVFEDSFREIDVRFRRAQAVNSLINTAPRHIVESAALMLVAIVAVGASYGRGGVVDALPVLGAFALGAQRLIPLLQQVYAGWSQCMGNIHALRDVLTLLRAPVVAALPRSTARAAARLHPRDRHRRRLVPLRRRRVRRARGEPAHPPGRARRGGGEVGRGEEHPPRPADGAAGAHLRRDPRGRHAPGRGHAPALAAADRPRAAGDLPRRPLDRREHRLRRAGGPHRHGADGGRGAPGRDPRLRHGAPGRLRNAGGGARRAAFRGRQRSAWGIARALYKRATLLIFDEVTSALDEVTEAAVMRSIFAIESGRTVVIVTHRLANLDECDFVVRMDGGRLVVSAPIG